MSDETAQLLEAAADATGFAAAASGPIGIAARIASLAFRVGAAFAREGKDPVIEIRRLLASEPKLAAVRDEWNAVIKRTFPEDLAPEDPVPAPPDTVPAAPPSSNGEDIYDGES